MERDMKKQTKQTRNKSVKQYQIVHTPAQRFWGTMAFIALFICGIMVGISISSNTPVPQSPQTSTEPVTQESVNLTQKTCTLIEESLLIRLPDADATTGSYDRIERAKIYANLSERGCPENQQQYQAMATQELEIARALQDDEFAPDATIDVVETYKRLNMQAAAEEIFETAKKLTNPAIDFILEVERIINEQ